MSILSPAQADNAYDLTVNLTQTGITLPDEVIEARERFARITHRKPSTVLIADVMDAYLAEVDDKTLRQLAVEHLSSAPLLTAWSDAKVGAGKSLRSAITGNGDTITAQLQELAAEPIAALEKAAELDTLDTATLVRNRRHEDAQIASTVELHAARLSTLYGLRFKVAKGAVYGDWGIDCSRWRDPRKLDATTATAGDATSYIRGIRAGAGLWFPLPAEAEAHAAPMVREAKEEHQAQRAQTWGVGSVAR